jgi:hypothetical protein
MIPVKVQNRKDTAKQKGHPRARIYLKTIRPTLPSLSRDFLSRGGTEGVRLAETMETTGWLRQTVGASSRPVASVG